MRFIRLSVLCAIISLTAVVNHGGAAQIESTNFADRILFGSARLQLKNVALMRYRLVLKPFVVALYLGDGLQNRPVLSDIPKRLEIEYYYALDGKEIANAADKLLIANVSPAQLATVRERATRMQSLYQNVKPGDRYSMTYIPGIGTELALNGRALGVIEGADFAAAYFSIWLGASPMDASVKAQLLAP